MHVEYHEGDGAGPKVQEEGVVAVVVLLCGHQPSQWCEYRPTALGTCAFTCEMTDEGRDHLTRSFH